MRLLNEEYSDFSKNLKEVSLDDKNKVSLIDDELPEHRMIKFDDVKEKICKEYRGSENSSCDGYFVRNGIRYLIEFKNQAEGRVERHKIRDKAFDSVSLLVMNENITREEIAGSTVLVIVYNNNKEKCEAEKQSYHHSVSLDKFGKKLKELSGKDGLSSYPIKFKLEKYIGKFYKEVYTLDVKVFKQEFMPILFGDHEKALDEVAAADEFRQG